MTHSEDQEEIVALSKRISNACQGLKNHIVLKATLNVCAAAIVNASDTLVEADKAADDLAEQLAEAVRGHWAAAHPN